MDTEPYIEIQLQTFDSDPIELGKEYTFSDDLGNTYSLYPHSIDNFKFVPYFIVEKNNDDAVGYRYFHIFENEEDFYIEDLDGNWKFKFGETFKFRKSNFPAFEIDKWVTQEVSNEEEIQLFLCDSLKPALGSFSERLNGMHARLTDGMRDEMIGNLNSIYYGIEGSKMDIAEGEAGGGSKIMTESLTKPSVQAPPGSSPYALRGEHIRRSLLNRGVDATESIDQVMYPWEQDFALNQAAKWQEKVKAMVYSVVGAIVTTQVDRRTVRDLKPAEWEIVRKEKEGFWLNGEVGAPLFRIEACAGPIWDSGDKKMRSVPNGDKEYSRAQMYTFLKKIEKKFNSFDRTSIADDTDTDLTDQFIRHLFGQQNDVRQVPFNIDDARKKLELKEVTDLENVNDVRDFFSNEMIKQGVFAFKSPKETAFAENTYQLFSQITAFDKKSVNFIYKNSTYPVEGFSYELQTLNFGPSNSFPETYFSIGHGINLLTEGTEIAASFLQLSKWAQAMRLSLDYDSGNGADNGMYLHTVRVDEQKAYDPSFVSAGAAKSSFGAFSFDAEPSNLAGLSEPETKNLGEKYIYYKPLTLNYRHLATWLADNFLGYCYERPHVVDKPMFAKLVNSAKIKNLCNKALESNFVKTSSSFEKEFDDQPEKDIKAQYENFEGKKGELVAQSRIFYFMKHESESQSAPKARRMENIIQPYLVSITASSVGTGIQSFMHMEDWWGPKPDYFSVEAEGIFILKQMASERFRKKRKFGGAFRFEGTIGEWFAESTGVNSFAKIVEMCDNQDSAAAVVVRLIEAVQAANEAVIDGGRTQRDKEGRQYVNQARFSYAMQLLEMKKKPA